MSDWTRIALGANSALYTLCCFGAGLATGNDVAWKAAIAAFGAQFLAAATVVTDGPPPWGSRAVASAFWWLGIALGLLSGFALLHG